MKNASEIFKRLVQTRHLLIGGRTGSGKSSTLNEIISHFTELHKDASFFFIDPKQTEWDDLAKELTEKGVETYYVTDTFEACVALWEIGNSDRGDVLVFIDELAEVLFRDKKGAEVLQKALSRENVRVYATTQNPGVIPKEVIADFPAALALSCCTEEESLHLVGTPDAVNLPLGNGVLKYGGQTVPVQMNIQLN